MKIYVIRYEDLGYGEYNSGITDKVYSTREKALEKLKQIEEEEKVFLKDNGVEDYDIYMTRNMLSVEVENMNRVADYFIEERDVE